MPPIDPELVQPLMAITETLRRRPGVATMHSIKKLSETYGFTTFVEHIHGDLGNVIRLSISGHVLLIDIDFRVPTELDAGLGSPMSPSAAAGVLLGEFAGLDRTSISHVSISSAITPNLIDGVNWDFIVGFGSGAENVSCSDVLYKNLTKEKTLDAFNKNLRVLLQFDRLSGTKPNDLFTVFSELACGMNKQIQLEETGSLEDRRDGVSGLGKVLCNYKGKIGVFLKYWIDDRYVHRWVRDNKKVDVAEIEYLLHFKVKESLKKDEEEEKDFDGDGDDESKDDEMDLDENGGASAGRLFNVDFGEWNVEKGSKIEARLNNITLELCPPVWVPEDLFFEQGVEFETVIPGNCGNCSVDPVDEVFVAVNQTGEYTRKDGKINVSMLVGCPMILVCKTTLGDLNHLQGFVQSLRTWCKLSSLLRKVVVDDKKAEEEVGVSDSAPGHNEHPADTNVSVSVSCEDMKKVSVQVLKRQGLENGLKKEHEGGKNGKAFRDSHFVFCVAEGIAALGDDNCGEKEGGDILGHSGYAAAAAGILKAVEVGETLLW